MRCSVLLIHGKYKKRNVEIEIESINPIRMKLEFNQNEEITLMMIDAEAYICVNPDYTSHFTILG